MSKFNTYTDTVDLSAWHELCMAEGMLRHFRKGEVFAERGKKLKYFGFVVKGYFKYVVTDTEGDRHITGFVFDNALVGDFLSIVRGETVKTDIIAACNAEVMLCNVDVFRQHIERYNNLRCIMAESLFRQAYNLYIELHVKSPKERYMALLSRCPDILQNITLKEMSSYLQITPTHLSRIRRELTFGT